VPERVLDNSIRLGTIQFMQEVPYHIIGQTSHSVISRKLKQSSSML